MLRSGKYPSQKMSQSSEAMPDESIPISSLRKVATQQKVQPSKSEADPDIDPDVPQAAQLRENCKNLVEKFFSIFTPSEEDLDFIFESKKAGLHTLYDMVGCTPEVCNSLESLALSYFRQKMYEDASHIYSMLLQLDSNRASAWRGLGACHQSTKNYTLAMLCYELGLNSTPSDVLCKFFLGECLCHVDQREAGFKTLQEAIDESDGSAFYVPYIKRARGILASKAPQAQAQVQAQVQAPQAQAQAQATADLNALIQKAAQQVRAQGETKERLDLSAIDALWTHPELAPQLEKLEQGLRQGKITLKDVAGFTSEQMDAGYAAACSYLTAGRPAEALQTVGWLMYLDERDPRFFQLAGICLHHTQLYFMADFMYGMSLVYDADNPTTLVYRGEAKIMDQQCEAGLALVRQGLEIAQKKPSLDHQKTIQRARVLLKKFGGGCYAER